MLRALASLAEITALYRGTPLYKSKLTYRLIRYSLAPVCGIAAKCFQIRQSYATEPCPMRLRGPV